MAPPSGSRPRSRAPNRPKLDNTSQLAFHSTRFNAPVYVSSSTQQSERETTALFQRWLHVPGTEASEREVASTSSPTEAFWADPSFPPGDAAVFGTHSTDEERQSLGPLVWRRVTGQLIQLPLRPPVLLQGQLENAWFLAALAAVACKPDLLLDLVVSDDLADKGLYTVQFYKHGCWHPVLVDNALPCLAQESRLAFCSSSSSQELWPSLLEKAYAKLHGSYAALSGGSIAEALVDLTGGVVTKLNLESHEQQQEAESGMLWHNLSQSLAKGSIIVCQAKHQGAMHNAQGFGGVLLNHGYSILDMKQLPTGTQLLKLHCPWEGGMWQGPWAVGSKEWQLEDGELAREACGSDGRSEPGTFWISYWDFVQVFNRLHTLQLFPQDWHQLTVHCGWVGPSGGPHQLQVPALPTATPQQPRPRAPPLQLQPQQSQRQHRPHTSQHQRLQPVQQAAQRRPKSGLQPQLQPQQPAQPWVMSSSWCCNPQFRLTLHSRGTVVLSLGQRDPQVGNQGHVPKAQRSFRIGLLVLRASKEASSSRGRRWRVAEDEAVADTGLSAAREVTVKLEVDADVSYVLVPYARQAGDQGPFVLRAFASGAMEVEQLPSPLSLVVGGQWAGQLAGGARCHPSWGSNPQYLLSCQRATIAVISLSRPDMAAADMAAAAREPQAADTAAEAGLLPYDAGACVGLTIAKPEASSEGLGRRATLLHESDVVAESGHSSATEAVLVVALQADTPHLLVPSTAAPGIEAPYELRILSAAPVELLPLPELKTVALTGAWQPGCAGGCNLHHSWTSNPRFLLQLPRKCSCSIRLSRLKGPWRKNAPLGEMIGFYILKAQGPDGQLPPEATARAVLHESAFVPLSEACGQYDLPGGVPLLVVPATYAAGVRGRFSLAVSAQHEFVFVALQ